MIRITFHAADQIEGLLAFYLYKVDPPRPEAALALLDELDKARVAIFANPERGKPYPAAYRQLARYGFRWLRIRSYWVSWAPSEQGHVVTNVFHAQADIERRATPRVDQVKDW